MAVIYGVLRGQVDRWKREDPPPGSRKSPHLQIRLVDGSGQPWRIPVNVRSGDPDKSLVIFHRADPMLSHPILNGLSEFGPGLTDLNGTPRSAGNALDYSRAPLFDWPTGQALPPSGPGNDDDLQDVVSGYLNDLTIAGGELFVFGSHFHDAAPTLPIDREFGTKDGVHDVHMNQGNPVDSHAEDNGVFHDGGLILRLPDRFVGLFFRFKTQFLPTDGSGNRIPGVSKEISPGMGPAGGGAPGDETHPAFPVVYIERALVNPAGEDPGQEIVVIGNTTMTAQSLSDWRIVDKNNLAEILSDTTLPAGGSLLVTLSGQGAQLSNRGGTIRLLNPSGDLVHAVSYAQQDIVSGRLLRFNN